MRRGHGTDSPYLESQRRKLIISAGEVEDEALVEAAGVDAGEGTITAMRIGSMDRGRRRRVTRRL